MKFYVRFKNGDLISEHKTLEAAAEEIAFRANPSLSYIHAADDEANLYVLLKFKRHLTELDIMRHLRDGFSLLNYAELRQAEADCPAGYEPFLAEDADYLLRFPDKVLGIHFTPYLYDRCEEVYVFLYS